MNRRPENQPDSCSKTRRAYSKPRLRRFGHISEVTQKTGAGSDLNRTRKPGGGGG